MKQETINSGFSGLDAKNSLRLGKKNAPDGPAWYAKCWIKLGSNAQVVWELVYSVCFFYNLFVIPFNNATKQMNLYAKI
tara:strand:- start:21 stop:257 length:237 start_codon:yes stop_codon:yes gene_type:complete